MPDATNQDLLLPDGAPNWPAMEFDMSGVHIREGATIAAGAVVLPGSVVGPNEYWSGNPARRRRSGSDAAIDTSTALPVD